MNREIKFRAWDYQNNRWASNNDIAGCIGLKFYIDDYFINIAGEKAKRFDFMQYTGLKDKNGKEIYEGDVLKYSYAKDTKTEDTYNEVVEWNETVYDQGFSINKHMHCEVIGNIYENKNLLNE